MSSLLALQTETDIVFASDTSLSIQHNGKSYRVSNNEKKLFEYPNFIMFASGKKYLVDILIKLLPTSPTINDVKLILDNCIVNHSEEYSLEIVIAMKDLSKLVFFSSTDNFKYNESLPNEYTNMFTAGCKTNEVADTFQKYYGDMQLFSSLEQTYKELSCAELGGNLDIIHLNADGIKSYNFKIDDIPNLEDEHVYKLLNSVHANRLVGRLILSNKLHIEDELGIVSIQSGIATFYDENGQPRVYIGKYPSYENPSNYKVGIRVDNGAFEMRTSSSSNSGMLIDGTGISAYNNNSVRTFRVDAVTGKVSIVGSLDIRTSPDDNKGVVISGDGIRIYNTYGGVAFYADNFGNVYYTGKLIKAYGDVEDLTGTIKDMDGNFVGRLDDATGTYDGEFTTKSLKTIKLDAEQITSGTIKADRINTDSLTAATIEVDQLTSKGIKVEDLSAISSNLGDIRGGKIEIDTDMRIGDSLYIGHNRDWMSQKSIIFAGSASITYDTDTLTISAIGDITLQAGRVNVIGNGLFVNGVPITG